MPRKRETRKSRHPAGGTPTRELLAELMAQAGTPLDEERIRQIWEFHAFLRERNRELNMTRIHNFESMVLKHYVDSVMAAQLTELPSPLLDIGSGPGFPGIPIKIARPEIRIVLAEGRARRAEFLEEAVELLGLEGVQVYGHKVGPRRNPAADLDVAFNGVITRALEDVPGTLRRCLPFLGPGARVFFMKGPDCDEEIDEARATVGDAYRLAEDIPYTLAATEHQRRLVIFERTDVVPAALPHGKEEGAAEVHFDGTLKDISSPSNATYRQILTLHTGKGIRKAGMALVSGARPVAEVLAERGDLCRAWITAGAEGKRESGIRVEPPPREAPEGMIWYRLGRALFKELDAAGTNSPLLLTGLPDIPGWDGAESVPGCTLLVPFQDPDNVGAVIRTAAAFGAARVVLLAEAAHAFLPKSQRAAGSALYRVPLLQGPSIRDIEPGATPLLTLSTGGSDLGSYRFPDSFLLLPGMEGPGLPETFRRDEALSIPMEPGAESLNAAAAVAIALYAWRRDRP